MISRWLLPFKSLFKKQVASYATILPNMAPTALLAIPWGEMPLSGFLRQGFFPEMKGLFPVPLGS